MLKAMDVKIDDIYVPADRRKELDREKADLLAEQIMEGVEVPPIQVRQGKDRYVLVKGIHRLEAGKALGDLTIQAFVVAARQH